MDSDPSGQERAGSGDPVSIVVTFDDGTRRKVQVSASEAARLAAAGTPVSSWQRWRSRLQPNVSKLLAIVLAGWFASIAIPAVVQQWSDRTKELELKNSLVTDISDSSADVISAALLMYREALPEQIAAHDAGISAQHVYDDVYGTAKHPKNPTTAAEKKYEDANAAKTKAEENAAFAVQLYFNDHRNTWTRKSASIEAQLAAYFDSSLAEEWNSYSLRVRDFLILVARANGAPQRRHDLLAFLRRTKRVGASDPLPSPDRVADLLLAVRRDAVMTPLLDGNAKGFSTGPHDLWRAVTLQD